jgi:hypothetical protein
VIEGSRGLSEAAPPDIDCDLLRDRKHRVRTRPGVCPSGQTPGYHLRSLQDPSLAQGGWPRLVWGTAKDKVFLSARQASRCANWLEYVKETQSESSLSAIPRCVKQGCPFGNEF